MNISLSPFAPESLVSRDGFRRLFRDNLLILHTLRLNLVLTHEVPPDFFGGIYLFFLTAIRHRISHEFIRSRNCVSMAFTAESLPA